MKHRFFVVAFDGTACAIACVSVASELFRQNAESSKMNINKSLYRTTGTLMWLLLALLFMPGDSRAVDQTFALIQTETAVYSNVTVTTKSKEYIVIQHASGLTSLKVSELSAENQQALGYGAVKEARSGSHTVSAKARALVDAIPAKQIEQTWSKYAPAGMPSLKLSPRIIIHALSVGLILYLFFCHCGSLICQKTGKPGGLLIWLPVLQFIPLFRAANMSPFWLLAMFVPILNIVAHTKWSFKISAARGQGFWTAFFLILPTYPLAFMYLAFASGTPFDEKSPPKKISLTGMTFDQV